MKTKYAVSLFSVFLFCFGSALAWADPPSQFPTNATFTTLIPTTRPIEGLTGDGGHNLYTGGSGSTPCPIWQINLQSPSLEVIGNVQEAVTPPLPNLTHAMCSFAGIAFDALGNLYQADLAAGIIYVIKGPNSKKPPDATIFAEGVPGTNGLAFDREGNLWTGDGTTGQGRVWKITGPGANCTAATDKPVKNCEEVFRIPPMRNGTALGGNVKAQTGVTTQGIGRQNRDFPPGTLTITVPASMTETVITPAGGQDLVANGIAFNREGDMFVIDTARGALWKVQFNRRGDLKSEVGCDTTFTPNTLCLSNVSVAHPILEGGDGIVLDRAGNIWVDANERNAVAVITKGGRVVEVFRNPLNANGLRNSADASVGNNHILEFPTSPFITGTVLCTSQSDLDRRDNSPRSEGEVNGNGKISCMDQELTIRGLPLPVR
jgi:sugar lactone lactonase YvrE